MLKEFLLVGCGSFLGGGMRFLVSKGVQALTAASFPFGTMTVNIIGCLLIGFLSGLPFTGNIMSQDTKMILTTGFCGGFTTFSTFMNESNALMKDENYLYFALYIIGSLAIGLVAVIAGHQLSKLV